MSVRLCEWRAHGLLNLVFTNPGRSTPKKDPWEVARPGLEIAVRTLAPFPQVSPLGALRGLGLGVGEVEDVSSTN